MIKKYRRYFVFTMTNCNRIINSSVDAKCRLSFLSITNLVKKRKLPYKYSYPDPSQCYIKPS